MDSCLTWSARSKQESISHPCKLVQLLESVDLISNKIRDCGSFIDAWEKKPFGTPAACTSCTPSSQKLCDNFPLCLQIVTFLEKQINKLAIQEKGRHASQISRAR